MGLIISESAIDVSMSLHILCVALCNSCWIKLDDGAIAAFIVPIVAIMLVSYSLELQLI